MIELNLYQAIELFNLQHGLYSPLDKFMSESDLEDVLTLEFPIPILLTVSEKRFNKINEKEDLYFLGQKVGELFVEEKEKIDINSFALKLFKTKEHPGYSLFLNNHSNYIVSGKVNLLDKISLKEVFSKKGWKTIAAFQTRNIPHLGHELVQRKAFDYTDGLLLSPVLGLKKKGDFKNEVIEKVYQHYSSSVFGKLAELYFLYLNMRYLGPREALFHAIVRKNIGATHFIIGRDHAGVPGLYQPYEAQEFAMSFDLGIEIIPVEEVNFCTFCKKPVFKTSCNHKQEPISGTYIRNSIINKKPDFRLLRKEVYDVLLSFDNPFVNNDDQAYISNRLLRSWRKQL